MSRLASISRREVIMAALAAGGLGQARADTAPRIAVLDWGWAATLVAIGVAPAGVAEIRGYAQWVREPALPPGTAELGLRTAPGFETLVALKPDLILTNALDAAIRPTLERIAPTLDNPTFGAARRPLAAAREAVLLLGDRLDRKREAERLVADTDVRIAACRAEVERVANRPVVPLQLFDRRHVTFYGHGSLYGDVLEALGLRAGYTGPTSPWGTSIGEIPRLATLEPAEILLIDPLPPGGAAVVEGASLFTSLLVASGHRLHRLPAVWPFGDLTAAGRFGALVSAALADRASGAPTGGTAP